MHVYCLYGRSDRCKSMAATLEKQGALRAFSPQVINYVWQKGIRRDVERDLLTGYIFAFYREKVQNFQSFYDLDGFIRKVGDRTMNFELNGEDLDFAMALYDEDGLIKYVHAVWEGSFVRLDDEVMNRYQARIIRMDKRKKRAKIEFRFENIPFTSWVALDMEDRPQESTAEAGKPIEAAPSFPRRYPLPNSPENLTVLEVNMKSKTPALPQRQMA